MGRYGKSGSLNLSARRYKKGKNLPHWKKKQGDKKASAPVGSIPTSEETFAISGRRLIDIQHFISQIQDSNKHGSFGCTFSDMQIISEKTDGLSTGIKMKCRICNYSKVFWAENPQIPTTNVNTIAITGVMSVGGGISNMEEFSSDPNIPSMSEKAFIKGQDKLSEAEEVTALKEMESAVSEERRLAMQLGDVDSESMPLRTEIVNGSWAKSSNETNFASLSCVSSGTASREEEKKDHIPLEPTVEIKEEPLDYDPAPSTSTEPANEEFILPHEDNTWTPPVHVPPEPVVEPQFTLSIASLASANDPETSDGEQVRKKRKVKSSTFVPSTNGFEMRPSSPVYNYGESSNPGSSKDPRKDQFDVFGEYIAAKLRSLDRRSCSYAQKAIGDIIFEAEMGKYLNEDTDCKSLKSCES